MIPATMEDEKPSAKLGDFYIGVLDFFAVLLPGVIAAFLLAKALDLFPEKPEAFHWAAVFVSGYILGHLLYAIGGLLLDPLLYDPLFKPQDDLAKCPAALESEPHFVTAYLHQNCHIFIYAKRLIQQSPAYINGTAQKLLKSGATSPPYKLTKGPEGIYKWARAWLSLHSAASAAELERLEADSKLFRSLGIMVPLILIGGWKCIIHQYQHPIIVAAVGVGSFLLVVWRYCDLRQKSTRTCYLHFVQLYSAMPGMQQAVQNPQPPAATSQA